MLKILPSDIRMPNGLSFEGTGTKSIIKWQTRTDWLDSGIKAFAVRKIEDDWQLYEREYQLDMHRWITRQLALILDATSKESVDTFKPILERFAKKNGDFFTNDVTANTAEQTIEEWGKEWEIIGSWDLFRDAAEDPATWRTQAERYIRGKLNRYTSPEVVARKGKSDNYDVAIRPNSWAGWCWVLIARDFYDGITYKLCSNFETCGREVASLTLKGNSTNKCSDRCRKAAYRKRKTGKEKEKDMPSLDEMAVAFEEFNTQEKGGSDEKKR